jgi:DNA-binding transcriptional LysR family regulator
MDIRFIESLLAAVERGSIVHAARAQGLTPAAISQRIQVLERDLGVPLLKRGANSASPTDACDDMLPTMRQLAQLSQSLRRQADPSQAEGVMRIGAISTMLTGAIPGILRRLRGLAPRLEPQIVPGTSAALYESLLNRRIDAALLVAPPFALSPALCQHILRDEPLCLLAPPGTADQPLCELFARMPHIAYDPQSWGGQIAARYLQDHRIESRPICTLDALEAISDLVADGIGVSLVPSWVGLRTGQPLPDGGLYARRIVLCLPAAPARPAAQHVFLSACAELTFPDRPAANMQTATWHDGACQTQPNRIARRALRSQSTPGK